MAYSFIEGFERANEELRAHGYAQVTIPPEFTELWVRQAAYMTKERAFSNPKDLLNKCA